MKSVLRFIIFLVLIGSLYLLTRFFIGDGGIPGMVNKGVNSAKQVQNDFFGNSEVIVDVDSQKDIVRDMQDRSEYAIKDLKDIFGKMLGDK